MNRSLLVASHNEGKIAEFVRLLSDIGWHIHGLHDVGLSAMDVEETGTTFAQNAALKATAYARASGRIALADDSGLVVDALDGAPGVYSARYGGPGLDNAGRRAHLLSRLAHVPADQRQARFVCVIAIHDPRTGHTALVEGVCEGFIAQAERDAGQGFGYDPLFIPQGYEQTFGELPPAIKDVISHRARAVAQVPALLAEWPA